MLYSVPVWLLTSLRPALDLTPIRKRVDLQFRGATKLFTFYLLQVECFLLIFPLSPSCTCDSSGFTRQIFKKTNIFFPGGPRNPNMLQPPYIKWVPFLLLQSLELEVVWCILEFCGYKPSFLLFHI